MTDLKRFVNMLLKTSKQEMERTCVVSGEVVTVNYQEAAAAKEGEDSTVTVNVLLDTGESLENVRVHYHCECHHNQTSYEEQETPDVQEEMRVGFEAFREGDRVLLLKERQETGDSYIVVGFDDGLPHKCFKCKAINVSNVSVASSDATFPASGPYPDQRIRETTSDEPVITGSPIRIEAFVYSEEWIEFYTIGGCPPYAYEVENIEPVSDDSREGAEVQFTTRVLRSNRIKIDKEVLGLLKVTVTDFNGHKAVCYNRVPGCYQNADGSFSEPSIEIDPAMLDCGGEKVMLGPDGEMRAFASILVNGETVPVDDILGVRHGYKLWFKNNATNWMLKNNAANQAILWSPPCDSEEMFAQNASEVVSYTCRPGRSGQHTIDTGVGYKRAPEAAPCDDYDDGEITYTTDHMAYSSTQILTATKWLDGHSSWQLTGGGSLSATDVSSITLTAAASNPDCVNNATIELLCDGEVVDSIDVSYYNSGYGAGMIAMAQLNYLRGCDNPAAYCNPGGEWYIPAAPVNHWDCFGTVLANGLCGSWQGPGAATEAFCATTYPAICAQSNNDCTGYRTYNGISFYFGSTDSVDVTSATMRANGCCVPPNF